MRMLRTLLRFLRDRTGAMLGVSISLGAAARLPGEPTTGDGILLEDGGGFLLKEDGTYLLLE